MKLRVKVSDLPVLLNGDMILKGKRVVRVTVESSESLIVETESADRPPRMNEHTKTVSPPTSSQARNPLDFGTYLQDFFEKKGRTL